MLAQFASKVIDFEVESSSETVTFFLTQQPHECTPEDKIACPESLYTQNTVILRKFAYQTNDKTITQNSYFPLNATNCGNKVRVTGQLIFIGCESIIQIFGRN